MYTLRTIVRADETAVNVTRRSDEIAATVRRRTKYETTVRTRAMSAGLLETV